MANLKPISPSNPESDVTRRPSWYRVCLLNLVPAGLFLVAGIMLIVALGLAQRVGWLVAGGDGVSTNVGTGTEETYTCPMHPQIRQPGAGRCPICGMELVPAASSSGDDLDELSVKIEPAQRRLANIQTAEVRYAPLQATIDTVGAIAIDESRMATIASYIDGRIERLFADYTGIKVKAGDHLAVIYSPELFTAQVEYLENRNALAKDKSSLAAVRQAQQKFVVNARRKLVELGLQEDQIRELETTGEAKSRQTVYAPMGGTVVEKLAIEGMYVKAGEPIYRIADLSTVWLKLELYPEDASRIRFGQRVEARLTSLPDEQFTGRVAFIDPTVDEQKRTVGVRVEFLNEDGRLRPGDYADATIYVPIGQQGEIYDAELAGKWISPMHPQIIRDQPGDCPICGMELVSTARYGYGNEPVEQPVSLYVPRSALLMAGQNSVVYVEVEPGRFEIRPVTLGPLLGDLAVVLEGLEEHEKVATAGNFLIDSQMQLAGKPSLIDPTRAIAKAKQRNEPLKFSDVDVQHVDGVVGEQIESLFDVYFRIQQSLASDKLPPAEDATRLFQLATKLSQDASLRPEVRRELTTIAEHSEHLHYLEIDQARHESFRPISHAMVTLASQVRGSDSQQTFYQMFCPMVKGGGGDWLQADDSLLNPYWGSQMLRCGTKVTQFSPEASVSSQTKVGDPHVEHDHQKHRELEGDQP